MPGFSLPPLNSLLLTKWIFLVSNSALSDVTAVILAGGLGTRLRTVVSDRPKVMALVLGWPFLAFLLDQVADAGACHVVLCTGYKAEQIEAAFGTNYRGMRISYSCETEPLGTAGALRLALPQIDSPLVLTMNGDSYCAANLVQFGDWHREHRFVGSLLLTHVSDASRYGRVLMDAHHHVLSFEEKRPGSGPGWINAGIYLLARALLKEIPAGRSVSIEREMFPHWISGTLGGFTHECQFLDIGTPESYSETDRFFAALQQKRSEENDTPIGRP